MIRSFKKPRSQFGPVSALLREVDEAISALYRQNNVPGLRPRFSMALIGLADNGPMAIRDLATFTGVTHGAMSQSVKAMKTAELVATQPGKDARSVVVALTKKGRVLIPFLEAEWDATEAMLAELENELPYPLSQVMSDIEERLAHETLSNRLRRHMAAHHPE